MKFDKTTIGGWALGAGIALAAAAKELPSTLFPKISAVLFSVAAGVGAIGAVLLGTYSTSTDDALKKRQIAGLSPDEPITARKLDDAEKGATDATRTTSDPADGARVGGRL